ncbi:pentatricopeptide repeat-containing protein At3g61520, mitochondrial-like [Aristolochia californica]|uniref:pentatricopeptide repeat-containing protein At3g61520, mitochondrial-like n=1 Tax=Aristolochia californica TaxID=171875 RepID=UPI0035E2CF4E
MSRVALLLNQRLLPICSKEKTFGTLLCSYSRSCTTTAPNNADPVPAAAVSKLMADVGALTEAVLRQEDEKEWNDQELIHIVSSSAPFTQGHLLEVIRGLRDANKALKFFEWWSFATKEKNPQAVTIHGPTAYEAMFKLASRQQPNSHLCIQQLLQKSREQGFYLTSTSASVILRSFAHAGLVDESLQVFLNDIRPHSRKTYLYNDILEALLLSHSSSGSHYHSHAADLVREMLQHPESKCRPNHVTCSILFSAFLKEKNGGSNPNDVIVIDLLLEVAKMCQAFPNSVQLTQLINKLCRSGNTTKAWNVLHAMKDMGRPIHVPSFNTLLTGLGRTSDFKMMNQLLVEMRDMGVKPSVVTFGILINYLCKSRRVDEALQVFDNMTRDNNVGTKPDTVIFNTLIDGLCKVGRPEEGLALLDKMGLLYGSCPNTVTFNCLIDGFCKAGDIDESSKLFSQMMKQGISPNEITLNAIIDGMCKHGRISSAINFFHEMCTAKGLKGNVITYTTLIGAFLQANNVDRAMQLFKEMMNNGLSPDSITYFTLISGLSHAGRLEEACSVAMAMKQDGLSLDVDAYNVLINGLCKKNKLDKAYELLQEMDKAGVKPNQATFNSLISSFSKSGDFSTAHQLMNSMEEPSVVTFGALIHGYCEADKLDEALKLFRDMRVAPNTVIYNILIDSLCKGNKVNSALNLMDEMQVKGVLPNVVTYNALFKGLRGRHMLEEAFELMDRMNRQGCNPDYITIEILTEWLSVVGETARLRNFLHDNEDSDSCM